MDFGGWLKARRMMGALEPDVLHFHNPVYWLHAALSGKGYKKLIHLHGPFFVDMMGRTERWLLGQSHGSRMPACASRAKSGKLPSIMDGVPGKP